MVMYVGMEWADEMRRIKIGEAPELSVDFSGRRSLAKG